MTSKAICHTPLLRIALTAAAALVLLLACSFAVPALEKNPTTAPMMRTIESAPIVGPAVKALSADAHANAMQDDKARGQASFRCYSWSCRDWVRYYSYYSGSTLVAYFQLRNMPYGIPGHPSWRSWVNIKVTVTAGGATATFTENGG